MEFVFLCSFEQCGDRLVEHNGELCLANKRIRLGEDVGKEGCLMDGLFVGDIEK